MPRCQSVIQSSKVSKAATKFQPPASRQPQPPAANKSDMCEKNRKIEFYLFTPAVHIMAWPAFDGFVICDSIQIYMYFTLSLTPLFLFSSSYETFN